MASDQPRLWALLLALLTATVFAWEFSPAMEYEMHDFLSVEWLSDSVVLIGGTEGLILRSTNKGLNWEETSVPETATICDLASRNGVVLAAGTDSTILRSLDTGKTWLKSHSEIGFRRLNSICFRTDTEAFAVGLDTVVLRSKNKGETWEYVKTQSGSISQTGFNKVFFSDPGFGIACGGNPGYYKKILHSSDSGKTWEVAQGEMIDAPRAGCSIPGGGAILVGADEAIWRLKPDTTWEQRFLGGDSWLTDVTFVSPVNGFICNNVGQILITWDRGATWHCQDTPENTPRLSGIAFQNSGFGIAVGSDGTVLRATPADLGAESGVRKRDKNCGMPRKQVVREITIGPKSGRPARATYSASGKKQKSVADGVSVIEEP